jgi:predicted adenylyl cyclase CyaB
MANNSKLELEAKVAIDDIEAMEKRLETLGAQRIGRYVETDSFFDFSDRRLKNADSAIRLRDRKDLATQQSNYRLTYKGPCLEGTYKCRREVEFPVEWPEQVQAFLEAIELICFAQYTKHRNCWRWGDCSIEVDYLEKVGRFIEVEGPSEERIRQVLASLDLAERPSIRESYLAMAIRHGLAKCP